MKVVVCVKQVPDTKGGVKFKPDGTLDRAAMLTIMNPDDKAGLEAAIRIKEEHGAEVTVITMGLPKADEMFREAFAMGADKAILVTDRVLGGADTWATSSTIAGALRNLDYDLVITGRQAIDGDTAQVGPQVAEKLNLPQVTYAEQVEQVKPSSLVVRRRLERGVERVECPLPAVITVNATAAEVRPQNARLVMKYKHAMIASEIAAAPDTLSARLASERDYLKIVELTSADIVCDEQQLGLSGSPTKVTTVRFVASPGSTSKSLTPLAASITSVICLITSALRPSEKLGTHSIILFCIAL